MQLKSIPFVLSDPFFDRIQKDPAEAVDELWFIVKDSKVLVDEESFQILQAKDLALVRSLYVGVFQKYHVHVGEIADGIPTPPGTAWIDLKMLYSKIDDPLLAIAGRAVQLAVWERTHQFCGQCGKKTTGRPKERAKECVSCNLLVFPRIAPVMMALIQRGDEILLARGSHFPKGEYSVLAGFVNSGETLEECVKREVFEEVGLLVNEITYFGSQPWPFPNSLMIAFTCQWAGGEIEIDPIEIEDARWFNKHNLPLIPTEISIARFLIDATLQKM